MSYGALWSLCFTAKTIILLYAGYNWKNSLNWTIYFNKTKKMVFFLPSIISFCFIYFGALLLVVYVYKCSILYLMTWPFHQYIMSFFVSWNNFWFKVFCLILAYPLSFDYYLHRISFSIFLFSSSVSLDLKWISYKQHINVFYFKPILSISTF